MSRVAGLAKHLVDLGGDARREVEGVQHEVADQYEVEDALELLARHQDGYRHRVGWKKRNVWDEYIFCSPESSFVSRRIPRIPEMANTFWSTRPKTVPRSFTIMSCSNVAPLEPGHGMPPDPLMLPTAPASS